MLLDELFVHFRIEAGNAPLVVLQVLEFDGYTGLGITRVVALDPWNTWKVHHPDTFAMVEKLNGVRGFSGARQRFCVRCLRGEPVSSELIA